VVLALALAHSHGDDPAGHARLLAERQQIADAFAMHLTAVHPRAAAALIGDVAYAILPAQSEDRALRIATDFRNRIGNHVLWLGERDARGVIAAFDVFAISSRKEGLPYVVLEAMSAGLPIVATTSAGVAARRARPSGCSSTFSGTRSRERPNRRDESG